MSPAWRRSFLRVGARLRGGGQLRGGALLRGGARSRWRSRLRWSDTVAESWLEVTRRPGRAVISGLGVALGAAAIVATLTLVATIQFQVSDEFDARRATQVEVRAATGADGSLRQGGSSFPPVGTVDRVGALNGVEGVAVVRETMRDQRVALNQVSDPTASPTLLPIHFVNVEAFDALELDIRGPAWSRWHDEHHERVALLSRTAVDALGVDDVPPGDRIFVNGLAFTAAGVVEDAPRLPPLRNGLVVPLSSAEMFGLDTDRDRIIAVVAPGAAGAVASVLPVALTPTEPSRWTAYAPVDDQTLRQAVDSQLEVLSLGLGGVVLFLGIVSIGNVTLSSVLQRIHEIGLRRALGARPRHIAAHILLDAAVLGAIGGLIGAVLGLTATLGVTAYQGWQPVIDPRIPPLAVVVGVLAGTVAGVYPARVGSRLQPTEALRRE
jgi:putative ABC transport system permease protein